MVELLDGNPVRGGVPVLREGVDVDGNVSNLVDPGTDMCGFLRRLIAVIELADLVGVRDRLRPDHQPSQESGRGRGESGVVLDVETHEGDTKKIRTELDTHAHEKVCCAQPPPDAQIQVKPK